MQKLIRRLDSVPAQGHRTQGFQSVSGAELGEAAAPGPLRDSPCASAPWLVFQTCCISPAGGSSLLRREGQKSVTAQPFSLSGCLVV